MGSTIVGVRDLSLHRWLAIPESATNYTPVLCQTKRISRDYVGSGFRVGSEARQHWLRPPHLAAALKVKSKRPEALILYVRRQN